MHLRRRRIPCSDRAGEDLGRVVPRSPKRASIGYLLAWHRGPLSAEGFIVPVFGTAASLPSMARSGTLQDQLGDNGGPQWRAEL